MKKAAIHLCKALAHVISAVPGMIHDPSTNALLTALADYVAAHQD